MGHPELWALLGAAGSVGGGGLVALGGFGVEEGLAREAAELREQHGAGVGEGVLRVFGGNVAGASDEFELFQGVGGIRLEPALGDLAARLGGGAWDGPV